MTDELTAALDTDTELAAAVADEYVALADLLETSEPAVWEAPSLCEGWRTREVVAHMTMPARYSGPEFMAELEAAGGDFAVLSDTIAARDGALPADVLLSGLRSERAARLAASRWRLGGCADALRHPRARHRRGGTAGAAGPRPSDRPCAGDRRRPGFAQPLRCGPHRRGASGRRPGLVLGVRNARQRTGAGAGPRGVRKAIAPGPARRRRGGPLHAGLRPETAARGGATGQDCGDGALQWE